MWHHPRQAPKDRSAPALRLVPPITAILGLLLASPMTRAHETGEEITAAARNFLAALRPEQRATTVIPMTDKERLNWHLIPRERRGLPLKEMNHAQRHLAHGLLSAALSHRGYLQATTIMSLEQVLLELEGGRGPVRDPELYFFTVFGDPDPKRPWGWRIEGHHLSLNFTMAGDELAVTPSVMGANPAEVRQGPRAGLRVLATEEDLGRALVKSLDPSQRQQCVFSETAPPDFILGPERRAAALEPKGLQASQMTEPQRDLLRRLVDSYLGRARPELVTAQREAVKANADTELWFAWAGSLEAGKGSYYRVQGRTFVLEFDNTQNNANHIHTLWRDLNGDFGEDLLRRHYEATPHGPR